LKFGPILLIVPESHIRKNNVAKFILHTLILLLLAPLHSLAAEVLVIADARLKPVAEVTQGMRKTLHASVRTVSPDEAREGLGELVRADNIRVVVALGREALAEALTLPPAIPVIYGLVVTPPAVSRTNCTGFYMAAPADEYAGLLRKYLPQLRHVAVAGSRDILNLLAADAHPPLIAYPVKNSFEFISTIRQSDSMDGLLLLPDSSVMTSTALEEAFLLSFRRRIPILGISERHVKEGALLALVVDMVQVGRAIGEQANRALKNGSLGPHQAVPPRKFDLYLNLDTARKMRIRIPDALLRSSRKAYP
jgi:putative tryptophan/tyrosine transport system substrate-binding protein